MSRSSEGQSIFVLLLAAIPIAAACSGQRHAGAGGGAAPAPSAMAPLPARAEVVARADELAVRGAKLGGAEGAKVSLEAAALRRRMWRVEGESAGALAAAAPLRPLRPGSRVGGCDGPSDPPRPSGQGCGRAA